jgi:hypothetical protein
MRKMALPGAILAGIIVAALQTAPAYAQATRTWVSGVGDDANPCSRTAPCKTFAGAISKTATGGEINVLDPGGFGAVTIGKSISIISTFEAGVLVSGTNGIIVTAPANSKVLLVGLDFEGLGTGINGVRHIGGGTVTIRNCSIRNFTGRGVDLEGTSTDARVYIQDSQIINNTGGGFLMKGQSNVANSGFIERVTFDLNAGPAVEAAAPGEIVISQNTLAFATSIAISNGGNVTSYKNNIIRGAGLPNSSLDLK